MTIMIPSESVLPTELNKLNLSFSKLFGQVPVSLSNILSLTKVNLIQNDFTGGMEAFCANRIEYSWSSADCLSSNKEKNPCSCCNFCSPW